MRVTKLMARATLPVWFGAFFVFPVFPTSLTPGAGIAKEAWWSIYGQGLPIAAPTTVPAGALGVGHNLAGPDKVAAVGITLDAELGSTVQTLSLALKEAEGTGANVGAASAGVDACPITGPWEPAMNGNWADVPTYDCELAKVAGKRADDGTWTFDLAAIGEQWLDADLPLEQAGVLLVIQESTSPTQVSFRGIKTGEFRLEFAATPPNAEEPVEPVVVGDLEPAAPDEAPAPIAEPAPADEAAPAVLLTQPAQNTQKSSEPDILGNLPWATWIGIPVVIALAALVSYALGSGANSAGRAHRRVGAVSRALSRGTEDR